MIPLVSFEIGRKTQTQSSEQPESCASKWKSGSIKKKPRLKSQHTWRRTGKNLHPRSSEARQRALALLTKPHHGSLCRTIKYLLGYTGEHSH